MNALDQLRQLAETPSSAQEVHVLRDSSLIAGYVEWLHGAECPWEQIGADRYRHTETGAVLLWHVGSARGTVRPAPAAVEVARG